MNAIEEVQLNDFKAHRASVLREIETANSTLHTLLVSIEEADTKYTTVLTNIASASSEHGAIVISTSKRIQSAIDAEAKATKAEESLAGAKTEFDEYVRQSHDAISSAQLSCDVYIAGQRHELEELEVKVPQARKLLGELIAEVSYEQELKETAQEKQRIWQETTDKERVDAEAELAQIKRDIEAEKVLLAKAKKDTAAEVAKIELPQQALAADYAKVAKIKRNVDVYAARIEKAYKQLYPDKPFII